MTTHETCYRELLKIRDSLRQRQVYLPLCEPYAQSALNMQDYISLKKHDLVPLQQQLSSLGLSSLGMAHFHILYTIEKELAWLAGVLGEPYEYPETPSIGFDEAYRLLGERAAFLKPNDDRMAVPSVMITLPSDAAENPLFIDTLKRQAIDLCRINTAHDGPEVWREMVEMIRRLNADARRERPMRIYVDLAGPKFRTGPLRRQPKCFKVKSFRTPNVRILPQSSGALTALRFADERRSETEVTIVVDDRFYEGLRKASSLRLKDSEGRRRRCDIYSWTPELCLAEAKGIRIAPDTQLTVKGKGDARLECSPEAFEFEEELLRLYDGDRLFLGQAGVEGQRCDPAQGYSACIACVSDDFLPFVGEGDTLYIDDGKIRLQIVEKRDEGVICEVFGVSPGGVVLKAEKGINFPDSDIDMPALTPSDLEHLETVIAFADIIGISFAQDGADIEMLKARLREQGREEVGIIAKIETKKAVRNLPMILLSLLPWRNAGVMLARGDLAIEVGFEKLPKVQSEVLDLCEAAHIPVIYATQILENMMKKNLPSRAEIIDASSAQRADCIMLNKGPFASHAVEVLQHILQEMQSESFKNKPLLHTTEAWKGFHDRLLEPSSVF